MPALACSEGDIPDAGPSLGLDERALSLLADEIIPASDGMPSASEAGVLAYFRRVSVPVPELADLLEEFMTAATGAANERYGAEVAALTSAQRVSLLQTLEADDGDLFSGFRNLVYEAYYVNPDVWALLGYEPYPTSEPGPSLRPFDPAMLDRVRAMAPFYVEAD